MKIISWNINGYRAITGQNKKRKFDEATNDNHLFDYISQEEPDIICLQETKAHMEQIDEDKLAPIGYTPYWHSCSIKKGYSGVAVLSKHKPEKVNNKFSIDKFDGEGRFIELDYGEFVLMNIYFPNGTSGNSRVQYKLEFYDALFEYANKLKDNGRKLLICGDYNTAHEEIDLARPKENQNTSGFLRIERDKIDEIIAAGYVDSFREFTKEGEHYTWWSHRMRARERNVGWRIDYHIVTENFMPDVINSYHQPEQYGSDHCPIIIDTKQ